MKHSLKYLCASLLILLSGVVSAQNCHILDVDYSVKVSDSSSMKGRAVLMIQGNAFTMSGNGIEAYCDGSSVWTVDNEAKEVYIEAVTPDTEGYMADLHSQLEVLEPGSETSFTAPDGQSVRIKVNSIGKSDGKDISSFRPTQDFNSSWVVTDLR